MYLQLSIYRFIPPAAEPRKGVNLISIKDHAYNRHRLPWGGGGGKKP